MPSLHIIYASTSGHTEYVVGQVVEQLKAVAPQVWVEVQRAELAQPEDLAKGDVLVLASGSWNTASVEGQPNPHMFAFLKDRAAKVDLNGKRVALMGLGDDRYHFLVGALTHLEDYVHAHGGVIIEPSLRVVNEPYGQEAHIKNWVDQLVPKL